ncbi:PRD domain-containing protein [Pantoea ananatis]
MARGKWLRDFEFCDAEPGWKTLAEAVLQSLCVNPAMPFSQSEIDFMAMNLVAFCTTTSSHNLVSEQYAVERTIMNHFLSYVSTSWFIHVNYDALSQATLLSHIRAMRIRVNNAITIVNPLLEQIKRHYPLMYELTLSAFSELDQFFKATVSADEIGYLVMHIGAILEDSIRHQSGQGMRALVVSDQGMASTRVVCQKSLACTRG